MSKYIRDLTEQLKGKNIAHFTKELQSLSGSQGDLKGSERYEKESQDQCGHPKTSCKMNFELGSIFFLIALSIINCTLWLIFVVLA